MGQWGGARYFCQDDGPDGILIRIVPHVQDGVIDSLHLTHIEHGDEAAAGGLLETMRERYVGKPYDYWSEFQWKPL
jgi:hypothetical protein